MLRSTVLVALVALVALVPSSLALALPPEQIAKRALDAVVTVRAKVGSQTRSGSGVLIERDVLATLASTVTGADKVEFRRVGEEDWLPVGPPVGTDRKNDLILYTLPTKQKLRVPKLLKKLPGIGAEVFAVSVPLKSQGSFQKGLVSGVTEKDGRKLVQMDAHVERGSRGGALVDDQARLVGLLLDDVERGGKFTYALPVELIVALRKDPKSIDPFAGVAPAASEAYQAGVKQQKAGRHSAAVKLFREALGHDESLHRARHRLARSLDADGKRLEAIAELKTYLAAVPEEIGTLYELGESERLRGNFAGAFEHFQAYAKAEKRADRAAYLKHANGWRRELTRTYERRAVVMETAGAPTLTRIVRLRLKGRTSLELIKPEDLDKTLVSATKGDDCLQKPTCVWRPAWARWVVASSAVEVEEGIGIELALYDVRQKKQISKVEVRSASENQLPLDIDDQLAVLLAELPEALLKGGAPVAGTDGEPRRRLILEDDASPMGDATDATETPGTAGTSVAATSGTPESAPAPERRASLREEEPAPETRRVAVAAEASSSSFNVMPFLLISTGVLVVGTGVAVDTFSPFSADYRLDAFDFIGPGIIAVGLATGVAGFFFFGGDDEEG